MWRTRGGRFALNDLHNIAQHLNDYFIHNGLRLLRINSNEWRSGSVNIIEGRSSGAMLVMEVFPSSADLPDPELNGSQSISSPSKHGKLAEVQHWACLWLRGRKVRPVDHFDSISCLGTGQKEARGKNVAFWVLTRANLLPGEQRTPTEEYLCF
jgi:hypothetical protein